MNLSEEAKAIREEIEKRGFVDYFFVGIDIQCQRISVFSIGEHGKDNGFSNCERWDRMVGAITRRMIQWELEFGGKGEDDAE